MFAKLFVCVLLLPAIQSQPSPSSAQAPDLNALSEADLKTLSIHFERTACYGTCPAYSVTIQGDGHVVYEGKAHVKTTGAQAGHIDPATVKALLAEFAQAKFLSLPSDYAMQKCTCRRCTDMPSAITELRVAGASHRVNHYYGCACAPKALFTLESAIDKAATVEQWTGDVSQEGPYGTTCWE